MAEDQSKTTTTQLTADAAAWLVAFDAGTVDQIAFQAWRHADPRHAVAFAEVARTWGALDRLRPLRESNEAAAPSVSRRALLRGLLAASVVAFAGTLTWPWLDEATAETGIGERRTVRLPEGALVELNTRTRVRWRRSGAQRMLWLDDGEIALFVPHNQILTVEGGRMVSLGAGSYNVQRVNDQLRVLGISTVAQISGKSVSAGAEAIVTDAGLSLRTASPVERDRAQAWRRGEIVFAGETLGDVLTEYNRYLDRPLVLASPEMAGLRLGGRFVSTDPRPFLDALAAGFGLDAGDSGEGPITITRRRNFKMR